MRDAGTELFETRPAWLRIFWLRIFGWLDPDFWTRIFGRFGSGFLDPDFRPARSGYEWLSRDSVSIGFRTYICIHLHTYGYKRIRVRIHYGRNKI